MKRKIQILSILAFLLTMSIQAFCKTTTIVSAEHTYYSPKNISQEQAEREAIEQAKFQALADAFGTLVDRRIVNYNENFVTLGSCDVKGEWLKTIEETIVKEEIIDHVLVITCKVKGEARERNIAKTELTVDVLRNGTDIKTNCSTDFYNKDNIYLHFSSPAKGYVAVYLIDGAENVNCLLPYRKDENGKVAVKANKDYIFFSEENIEPYCDSKIIERYLMTCDNDDEINYLYFIYSPNPFVKAPDNEPTTTSSKYEHPRQLSMKAFQKWLFNCQKDDVEMQVIKEEITITKRQS